MLVRIHAGAKQSDLLGDDSPQDRQGLHRRSLGQFAGLPGHDLGRVSNAVEEVLSGITAAQSLAEAEMLGAVHVEDEPMSAQRPRHRGVEFDVAEVQPAVALDKHVGFRPGEDDKPVRKRPEAEDRADRPVLPGEIGYRVSPHAERVADQRQSAPVGERYGFQRPSPGRPGTQGRPPPPGDGVGLGNARRAYRREDRTGDQIHLADELEPVLDLGHFRGREQPSEDPASIHERDQHDIPGGRNLVREENGHDTQLDFTPGLAVHLWIPARASHPARHRKQSPRLPFHDAPLDQAVESALPHLVRTRRLGQAVDPPGHVPGLGGTSDRPQAGIEQIIADRGRIDKEETLGIGVDAVLQRQVHQHGPGEGAPQIAIRNRDERPGVLVEQKEDQFFGESEPRTRLRCHHFTPSTSFGLQEADIVNLVLRMTVHHRQIMYNICTTYVQVCCQVDNLYSWRSAGSGGLVICPHPCHPAPGPRAWQTQWPASRPPRTPRFPRPWSRACRRGFRSAPHRPRPPPRSAAHP